MEYCRPLVGCIRQHTCENPVFKRVMKSSNTGGMFKLCDFIAAVLFCRNIINNYICSQVHSTGALV